MNSKRLIQLAGKVGFVLSSAFFWTMTGCTTYVEQPPPRRVYYEEQPRPREVYVAPPAVVVETSYVGIRTENDFYEPLSPYGRWEVVGAHGRCWIPGRVEADWRPYSNGYWQRTDAGWYWASDEPWAWATYHYGRWDVSADFGWYWVPQTQWAPAWVSWHHGGGYVGWAPLQPSVRIAASGVVAVNVGLIAPRAFVFVEERRFLEPVRPTTVVVNNTTIINKTVNITNIKVVNNTVINEGPRTTVIEQVSGQKVQAVPVRELRRKQEAEVVARQRITTPPVEKKVQPTVHSEAAPRETKAIPAPESRPIEKPAVTAHEPPALNKHETKNEKNQIVPSAVEARPVEVKPEAKSDTRPEVKRPPAIREPIEQKVGKHPEKQDTRGQAMKKKVQPGPPLRGPEKQGAIKRGGTNTVERVHPKKVEEPQAPEKPGVPR